MDVEDSGEDDWHCPSHPSSVPEVNIPARDQKEKSIISISINEMGDSDDDSDGNGVPLSLDVMTDRNQARKPSSETLRRSMLSQRGSSVSKRGGGVLERYSVSSGSGGLNDRYSVSTTGLGYEQEMDTIGRMSRQSMVRRMTNSGSTDNGTDSVGELRITHIPASFDKRYLEDLFNSFGKVEFMMKFNHLDHLENGYVVRYSNMESSNRAYLGLGHMLVDGKHLGVDFVLAATNARQSVHIHRGSDLKDILEAQSQSGSEQTNSTGLNHDLESSVPVSEETYKHLARAFQPLKFWTSFLTLGTPKGARKGTKKYLFLVYSALVALCCFATVGITIWDSCRYFRDGSKEWLEQLFRIGSYVYLFALFIVDRYTLHTWKKFKVLTDYIHMEEEIVLLGNYMILVMRAVVGGTIACFVLILLVSLLLIDDFMTDIHIFARLVHAVGLFYLLGFGGATIAMFSAYRFLINLLIKRFGKKVASRVISIQSMVFRYDDLALLLVKMTEILHKSLLVTFGFGYPVFIFGAYVAIYEAVEFLPFILSFFPCYILIFVFVYFFASDPQLQLDNVLRNMTYMNCLQPFADPNFFMIFLNQTQYYKAGIKLLGITLDRRLGVLIAYVTTYITILMLINKAAGGTIA